jgi:hypothetical protein
MDFDFHGFIMAEVILQCHHSDVSDQGPNAFNNTCFFCGLQDDIKMILHGLPMTVPWAIKKGLLDAHKKLSDYYHKFNESLFYTWAVCK